MNRPWTSILSVILLIVTLFLAVVLLMSAGASYMFGMNMIIALAAIILALLFVGVQLYAIADKMPALQSS